MISKTAITFLISAVLFTSPVLAQNSTTPAKIPAIKQKVENRADNVTGKIASRGANVAQVENRIQDIKIKIATKEAALKAKLATFRDQKKAETTERINTNLNNININRTNGMLKNLSQMSTILDKLESRIKQGTPDIKDPITAKAAVASARGAIASASAMVQTQAQKDYTITVTSETKVKSDVQKVRTQLANDLQAVRKQVISAKQSVSNAIMTAKSGKNIEKEGTASGQQ